MRVIYSVSNLFCEPYNFWKQQGCRKRQKVGRNQSPHCSTIFPLCCYDAGCDLLLLGQHLSSLLQVILHCTHSPPIKLKPFQSSSASCGRMGCREKPAGLRARLQRSPRSSCIFYAAARVKTHRSSRASALQPLSLLHMFISAQHISHTLNVALVALWVVLTFHFLPLL